MQIKLLTFTTSMNSPFPILSIIIASLTFINNSFSQEVVIPKRANKIILLNDKTAEENFTILKQSLAEAGIEVANQDKDIFQIKTGAIITKGFAGGSDVFLLLSCKDSSIIIRGQLRSSLVITSGNATSDSALETVSYTGFKGSIYRKAWEGMDNFARSLNIDRIYYEVAK